MKRENVLDPWSVPFRHALMKGAGFTSEQIRRPLVGVLNGSGDINPAAGHLDRITNFVKKGIESAGGTPIEFSISALCGGMAGGGRGSSYSLAYRDVVADFVELIAEVNFFDGIIFTSVCDDVVPAHLMACARINLPSILLLGGYMAPKIYKGKTYCVMDVATKYAEMQKGEISEDEYEKIADIACGNCGACPIMGTANTMGAIAETLGMTLPGNSTVSGSSPALSRLAYQSGVQIMSLIRGEIKAHDILTKKSVENSIRVFLALGGSTNALIHIPAIAAELGMDVPLSFFDSLSRETPFLCNVRPSGKYTMKELDEAGGLPALLKELTPVMHMGTMTVTGKTLGENIKDSEIFNPDVIFPFSKPISKEGGVAILKGSLAPHGAVVRIAGLDKKVFTEPRQGHAKVFDTEREACEQLMRGEIRSGDIIVIRYVGPKGDPGMRITARFLWLLSGMKLDENVTVISDGRFSGTNKGGAIGHVCPEAANGGPIAIVENGDIIEIDISNRKLELVVAEEEIRRRLDRWSPPEAKFNRGLLARISKTMLSVEKGAILQRSF